MTPPWLHSLRDVAPPPQGAHPLAGETPARSALVGLAPRPLEPLGGTRAGPSWQAPCAVHPALAAQRCHFVGDAAPGAPQVWALRTAPAGAAPGSLRQAARAQARAALRALLAAALCLRPAQLTITDQRGQSPRVRRSDGTPDARLARLQLSISHEAGCSLLTWCGGGAVGVDVQAVSAGPAGDPDEWRRVAALYLGPDSWPNQAESVVDKALEATQSIAFMTAWTQHEARLKCLGEPLQEWSPALQSRLDGCMARRVALPAPWVGAVAWRPAPA